MNPEPSPTTAAAASDAGMDRPIGELVRWAAGAFAALLFVAAGVLCWRRMGGQLSLPLGPAALLAVAATAAAAVAAGRVAWRYGRNERACGRFDRLVPGGLTVAVVLVGAALSLPGTSPGGLFALWGILVAEELGFWCPTAWRRWRSRRPVARSVERAVRVDPPQAPAPHSAADAGVEHERPTGDVLQQLTRSRGADGVERLSGWLRVPLTAGQRNTSVHVAFCPPFARTPGIAVRQLEGPQARIKTVQLLPYGARFDLKLASRSDAPGWVVLQLSARAEPPAA